MKTIKLKPNYLTLNDIIEYRYKIDIQLNHIISDARFKQQIEYEDIVNIITLARELSDRLEGCLLRE